MDVISPEKPKEENKGVDLDLLGLDADVGVQ